LNNIIPKPPGPKHEKEDIKGSLKYMAFKKLFHYPKLQNKNGAKSPTPI
jgi:hypothetical protein